MFPSCIHLEPVGQGNAMVSSSAPSVFSVQALALLAEVGHYPTIIPPENIQETHYQCFCSPSDSSPSSGYGISQWWERESCASHLPPHVLCLPLSEKPQVSSDAQFSQSFSVYILCKLCSTLPILLFLSLSLSAYNMPSFSAGAQLLSSLSGYAYTKRAWKKEVLELFMDPLFFTMDMSCFCQ